MELANSKLNALDYLNMIQPKLIKRLGTAGLEITWSNGNISTLSSKLLRENCPSAVSLAKRGDPSHEKPLSPKKSALNVISASAEEELRLEEVWSVGNYAIGLRWGDGHDSGIYTFEYLRSLAQSSAN